MNGIFCMGTCIFIISSIKLFTVAKFGGAYRFNCDGFGT